MNDKTIMLLGEALGRISKLNAESAQAEHTDVGDVWDTLYFARDAMRAAVSEVVGDDPIVGSDAPGDRVSMDKVCEECGGNDISFEGWISWSVEYQRFEVDDVCDKGHHCKQCDGTTHTIDVEWKPYCIEIASACVEGESRTFRFNTREEVAAFHDGMLKGVAISEWEVTYTDEESE
jgi:hypothetical protein